MHSQAVNLPLEPHLARGRHPMAIPRRLVWLPRAGHSGALRCQLGDGEGAGPGSLGEAACSKTPPAPLGEPDHPTSIRGRYPVRFVESVGWRLQEIPGAGVRR